MNHKEINDLAREAGLWVPPAGIPETGALVRFFHRAYELGAVAERESCAQLCENQDPYVYSERTANACAAAIRSRSNK